MNHLSCPYCRKKDFSHLDEISSHLATVNDKGKNVCSGLDGSLDPHGALELFPTKVGGKKYAPKNGAGKIICFTNKGKIAKDEKNVDKSLVHELLNVKSPIGGVWDVGHYIVKNWLGVEPLLCFYCDKELGLFDSIDYCDWLCHFEDYFKIRKKAKRTDEYFKG